MVCTLGGWRLRRGGLLPCAATGEVLPTHRHALARISKNICLPDAAARMVLPPIRPLSEEEWNNLVAALRRGPTPEQVRAVERAKEIASTINVLPDTSTIKNIVRLDPDEVARRLEKKFAAEEQARKARCVALRDT